MAARVEPARSDATRVRLLWVSTLVLVLISVAMVTRRTLDVLGIVPARSALTGSAPLDAAFAGSGPLTMLHILPGLMFVVLGPLQFLKTLRTGRPQAHRRIGRIVDVFRHALGDAHAVQVHSTVPF
jgi:hypothetical protein